MTSETILNVKSLKEQVYEYLREQINSYSLRPGDTVNMDATSRKLGISKTPLRDALIQLEVEGFVTIAPRKGIYVNALTLGDIQNYYQVIGALESSALAAAAEKFSAAEGRYMERLNSQMAEALEGEDFSLFYKKNLAFHDCYLDLCGNRHLTRIVCNLKKRLYDFPPQRQWIKEWELSSIREHRQILDLLTAGHTDRAAKYVRDVHWSFAVQEPYIRKYYFPAADGSGPTRE